VGGRSVLVEHAEGTVFTLSADGRTLYTADPVASVHRELITNFNDRECRATPVPARCPGQLDFPGAMNLGDCGTTGESRP